MISEESKRHDINPENFDGDSDNDGMRDHNTTKHIDVEENE